VDGRYSMTLAIGRALAIAQGVIWFTFLLFSLVGVLFGPMAWVAASVARRDRRLSGMLLIAPVAFLWATWLAWFVPDSHPIESALFVAGLVTLPAIFATTLIWLGGRPARAPRDIQ